MVRIGRKRPAGSGSVAGVSSTARSRGSRKTKVSSAGGVSFASSLDGIASVASADSVSSSEEVGLSKLEDVSGDIGLLSLQEQGKVAVGGEKERKRAIVYGEGLLERLESLHMRLLSGCVSVESLHSLESFFSSERGVIKDARLRTILAEIELRVQIELAKIRG